MGLVVAWPSRVVVKHDRDGRTTRMTPPPPCGRVPHRSRLTRQAGPREGFSMSPPTCCLFPPRYSPVARSILRMALAISRELVVYRVASHTYAARRTLS